uniref:Alternative protein HEPACAM n=1 Tax=Homo sapiens TaxID=9606 RepID=L0R4Y5_HUMAN|nr:alternative protein HEPACAM [Homo sapiens]
MRNCFSSSNSYIPPGFLTKQAFQTIIVLRKVVELPPAVRISPNLQRNGGGRRRLIASQHLGGT